MGHRIWVQCRHALATLRRMARQSGLVVAGVTFPDEAYSRPTLAIQLGVLRLCMRYGMCYAGDRDGCMDTLLACPGFTRCPHLSLRMHLHVRHAPWRWLQVANAYVISSVYAKEWCVYQRRRVCERPEATV
jgi:hypothetical protein